MTSNMSNLNTNFDPDYDSFLNLENDFTPSSTSPAIKSVPMLTPQSSIPGSATTFASSSTPQTFPGPSFQYDAYHQQTGIPIGALANTFAVNRASGLQYHEGNGGFIMPTETLNMPLSTLDEYDFSQGTDMDFDTDSPNDLPSMFYSEQSSRPAQFVSPNTLVAHNNMSSTPIQRIYPGMHSQQAAQAKAQQAQKQQMARQQQQARPDGQKPLPSPTKSQLTKDPLVEESISKVLNRMRQESITSTATDGDSSNVGMSNMPRIKKDEDDMDEDERLLASEEGKKLSSKERRQLRNKVSARAFRSRRKEYIGQLEGEIAAKSQEANDMRAQNEQLREENNRLTDLTRMLLSSQAFAGFLQELSQSGLPPPNAHVNTQQQKQARPQPQPQPQSKPRRKDVSSNDASHQMQVQQPQIGMALIPETPIDLSAFQPSNAWMTALPTSDFQVYAVTELPEAPVLDLEALSGKSDSIFSRSKSTKDMPKLPDSVEASVEPVETKPSEVDETILLDREAFALYFEMPVVPSNKGNSTESVGLEISEEQQSMELKKLVQPVNVAATSQFRLVFRSLIPTESFFARDAVRKGLRWDAGVWPLQTRFIHVEPPRLKAWVSGPDELFTPGQTNLSSSGNPLEPPIAQEEQARALKKRTQQAERAFKQKLRMEERAHANKSVGIRSAFSLQFITTPTSDTPGTSLLLRFDNKRYIFGEITEGTQRACIQRGIGLKKVRGLFLTGKTAWNNGGLIGMILSLADAQASEVESEGSSRRPRLHIYAGPKQLHSLACARRFIFRTGMPLSVHEADILNGKVAQQPILEDENIRVWAIATRHHASSKPSAVVEDDSDLSDKEAEFFQDEKVDESRVTLEQDVRSQIVNNMFDSDWHRDRLSEHKVKDINFPAVVWVRDPQTKTMKNYTLYDREKIAPFTPESVVLVRDPWPASMVHELPKPTNLPNRTSMSYIVKGHSQRGKFDPVRAKALGVKPGPIFSKLVAGMSVTLEDGSVITSDMVMSPSRPGRGFAIFDVPSPGYLSDLSRQLQEQSELLEGVELVVWLTRDHVPLTPEFQTLLDTLKDKQHVLSHPDICHDYISQDSSARATVRLSNISPELFSLPRFNNDTAYSPLADASTNALATLLKPSQNAPQIVPADRGLLVHIEPTFRVDSTEVPANFDENAMQTTLEPEVCDLIPSGTLANPRTTALLQLSEPEIITLGTGSAAPSKYRNVSAVLLLMPDDMGNYLFDCGEGTLGQLKRLFDAEQLDELLSNLKVIWISHLHADHHLGTVSLLQAIYQAGRRQILRGKPRPSPPLLMSEVNMKDYIEDYRSILSVPDDALCRSIVCHWTEGLSLHDQPFDFSQTDIPIRKLETVRVNHCHGAQAISVTFENGFKFSYSGDCRPSRHFCEIGADSDVLVHESTFDDGMEGDAMAKKHSTTGEAVGVALEMKAKNLILTHFSQRYSKIPVLSSVKLPESTSEEDINDIEDPQIDNGYSGTAAMGHELSTVSSQEGARAWSEPSLTRELPVAIAFDLMRIRVSQIALMKDLFPAISKMFELDEEKMELERQERIAEMKAKGLYKSAGGGEKPSSSLNQSSKAGERKKKHQRQQEGTNNEGKKRKDISGTSNGHVEELRKDPLPVQTESGLVAEVGEKTGVSRSISDKNAKCAQTDNDGNGDATMSNSLGVLQQQVSPADATSVPANTQVPEIESMTLSPEKRRKTGDMTWASTS